MNTKNLKFSILLVIAAILFYGCGTKINNNKFIGTWQGKGDVTIVLEKDGIGNMEVDRGNGNQSLKWTQINEYVVIEFSKLNKKLYAKINNTGDDRSAGLYDSDKFSNLIAILIKQ